MRDDKTPVRIRTKEITGGRKSIYLDIYQEGKRTYEFLRLYLLPPTSRANKDKNKETMMLTLGNDIYTTSKLLGHRSVRTTQIYARIVDEKRKKAVESIPALLPENL